jgi:serine/threonine-protein kinase
MGEQGAPVAVGEVVAGKYRIERVIGAGGMGIVVAATQLELDRAVAIKFLLPDAAKDPDTVARFSREARAAAKIHGEHVARVLDVGVVDAGLPYMVMEYLEGVDLARRLAEQGRLPVVEIARYLLEACEALAEAHAAGIVHRDLKPANLFLARRPDHTSRIKLLDFGISKASVGLVGGITSTETIMGSPVYMSPEQLMSTRQADPRADIWSLGIVLYEALVGAPPFFGESMPQVVTRILHAPAPRLSDARPELPAPLDGIVSRCLEKDPAARFADVAELAWALAPFAPDGTSAFERIARVLGRPPPPPPPPPGLITSRPTVEAWGGTQTEVPKTGSAPWIVAGPWTMAGLVSACALLAVAAVAALRGRSQPPSAAVSIVAPPASAAGLDGGAVKLAPPSETAPTPGAPTPSVASASTGVDAAAIQAGMTRPRPGVVRGRPPPTPAATVPVLATATAPAPTSHEPVDPLRMGIK